MLVEVRLILVSLFKCPIVDAINNAVFDYMFAASAIFKMTKV